MAEPFKREDLERYDVSGESKLLGDDGGEGQ